MKKNLILLNLGLLVYIIGLLVAIGISFGTGAILVLLAAAIIVCLFVYYLHTAYRSKSILSWDTVAATLSLLVVANLFVQGYGVAIGKSLFGLPGVYTIHTVAGFLLLAVFTWSSVRLINQIETQNSRYLLIVLIIVFTLVAFVGYLGFARIVNGTVKLVYYSHVFLTFAYLIFILFTPERKSDRKQFHIASVIILLTVIFWLFRWQIPDAVPSGLSRTIFQLGFITIFVLPAAILLLKKNYFIFPFLIYSITTEIFFLNFNRDFKYLTDVGFDGCVGYEDVIDYPVTQHPGISIPTLLDTPSDQEILAIREEWKQTKFEAKHIRVEYKEQTSDGDSIQVISHDVNGLKHYGLIRIPAGLDVNSAPILLVLNGGGSDVDVVEPDLLYRIASGLCRDVLQKYIVIAPSFRGDIVRGANFCFRSQGYTGDVWAGAAEDAAFFLEAVKKRYQKDSVTTVAIGVSRGATVALILGGLTDKITHAIAISTHADFLNEDVFMNERVGGDFPRIFFTPRDTPEAIRRKLLASSPLYFAEHIASFEIHQGTADHLTTVRHARAIQSRLKELDSANHAQFYFYEGKGHGADDDHIVCSSLQQYSKPIVARQ